MFKDFMSRVFPVLATYAFIFIIFYISIMSEYGELNLNPFDYTRITDVDYKAVVCDTAGSSGKVNVTERIKFNVHAASKSNLFWELWRDLVESEVDGLKVTYNVNSVKQILDNGNEILYSKSPKLYWNDSDYLYSGRWYHSPGPYNPTQRRYECVLFYVDGMYRETPTFEINYDMYNATLRYKDCSELYLSLYSGETLKYLNSFKAQILVPEDDMPQSGNYYAHTFGTNSNNFPFNESDTLNPGYHTFSFDLNENQLKFKPYNQYIEFALISYGKDKHIFSEYANNNLYTNDNVLDELKDEQNKYDNTPQEFFIKKCGVFLACILLSGLALKVTFNIDKKIKQKYNFYNPEMQHYYFRDIPSNLDPNFASHLVFCKHKQPKDTTNNYSAILLSLVRKKYIELVRVDDNKDWNHQNINIIIKYKPKVITNNLEIPLMQDILDETANLKEFEPLTLSEEYYFNLILKYSNGNNISMIYFENKVKNDYENTDKFVRNIENSIASIGLSENYFQKSKYTEPKDKLKQTSTTLMIFGILLIIILNFASYSTRFDFAFGGYTILGISLIACAIYLKKNSSKYVLLTQFGEDEYSKWRGLYNFLNSETLMNERTVVELPLWEQYLVYATAFGISDKVIRALQIRCPDMSTSPMLSNSFYRSPRFRYSAHSFSSATHHASSIARSGSHSYGYGGGGRGGGGGRRRTLIHN